MQKLLKSIDKKFIILILFLILLLSNKSISEINYNLDKNKGITALMYHRFDENKYPSTNIEIEIFKKHISEIKLLNHKFIHPNNFKKNLENNVEKVFLLTIDDAFTSFYKHAWPILRKEKIPFILFVNTETVGSNGYMSWDEIKEIKNSNLGLIGNHSHTHGYLVEKNKTEILKDLMKADKLFREKINFSPKFFSYPFGEYSDQFKEVVNEMKFEFAFGQHSGVIDITHDKFELPRYSINEKYGNLKRFKTIINTLPFPHKKIIPEDKYLSKDNNPPIVEITFYPDLINIKNINCFSNEGGNWHKSKIQFINEYKIKFLLEDKFVGERGRINCSLKDKDSSWRWLGIQFVVGEK